MKSKQPRPNYDLAVQQLYLEMFLSDAETFSRCQNIFDPDLFDARPSSPAERQPVNTWETTMQKTKLDKEEQDILDSFERGEWKPVANRRQEIARHVAYARNTLAKDRRVNIRISSKDLEELQAIAVEDGVPYQTLMASVLHRFVSGRFMETPSRTRKSRLPRVPLGT